MNILAVIPVRGGSKGIPRKNVRLMNGRPLVFYAVKNAKGCEFITDVAVTTDDLEIMHIVSDYGVDVIEREKYLAGDMVTLDPVVYDALLKMERRKRKKYDIVITLQATSPLLNSQTLNNAIKKFIEDDADTCISVVNKPHLAWTKQGGEFVPLYEERLNRQQLPSRYSETGAFLISKKECIKEHGRIGRKVSVFEIHENEAIDIDTYHDWIVCENELRKKRIILRADGYQAIGMGHIYHCLTLAYSLIGHEVLLVTNKKYTEGLAKIIESNMPYEEIADDHDFFELIRCWKPDIIVNDCLNTSRLYMKELKKNVSRVVTIEDLGEGAKLADAVINALYENSDNTLPVFWGEKYICLRDEFLINAPKPFSEQIKEVLILFGGTDPGNFTKRIYDIAEIMHVKYPEIIFNFVTGLGYDCEGNQVKSMEHSNIHVINNTNNVSKYMKNADLAFTSQGRTVYELASLGIPAIVLAQNERETMHSFAQMKNGFLNLGLGRKVHDDTIIRTFEWLISVPQVREEMRSHMLSFDLKRGIERVRRIILGEEIYE